MLRGVCKNGLASRLMCSSPSRHGGNNNLATQYRRGSSSSSSEKKTKEGSWGPIHTITGLGAAVVALATQTLAQEIAGGLSIMLHRESVAVGDKVKLNDGTVGFVHRLGWVSSTIRGYVFSSLSYYCYGWLEMRDSLIVFSLFERLDDIYIQIPNSLLIHHPLTNITRAKRSQVKQTLRFKYKDLNKIPIILQDIKDAVKETCPKLVMEGATYRAVITSYESDHVQALVNFHFEIPSQTEAFHRNRQEVLLVIANVMKKHRVEFALPIVNTHEI